MKRILVISPHPDDEAIGCGGTLRKHVLAGDAVQVIFLTSGEKGGHGRPEVDTIRIREREAYRAAKILGVQAIEFWHLPDGAVKPTRAAVNQLRAKLKKFKPDTIYVPHDREMHPDHLAAMQLLRMALRGGSAGAKKAAVLMFEVWTPLQRMDHIEDISEHIQAKLAAIRAYKSQCAVVDFAEAFRGLARYRGEMHCWPEGEYAEVFSELRLGKK
jgi:LmbE family N-acetylglucosaminyl deacetylase